MSYQLMLSNKVRKQLKKLDPPVAEMIIRWLKANVDGVDNPRKHGKALTGEYKDLWRYRVGNYRIICDVRDRELIILALAVGHRKDIYK
ncbi:type II toxin-antitoxin system RelE family toxin [Dolosigranulum pigrum]|uniref:type II toxin-antitoxin system RelE family toxin n=1 Tax=Dolosigranulum pigrum TaxID=29394 RepID=UPI001AD88A8B|nr:type II toxin-antitoxin system RelE/ParE family toxin [Dolosigranulum pigrum]QTJ44178.1 type II toxin-antitoxin system RelE/ParE family toxin [Dolosigranulum pigrum]